MSFKRAPGPFDATMVAIGGIIGSGIFINPYIVAQRLDSVPLVRVPRRSSIWRAATFGRAVSRTFPAPPMRLLSTAGTRKGTCRSSTISQRYGVQGDQIATAQGASGANFLVCAALLEPGDEVLVETPGYDPLLAAPRLVGARVARFERDFADGFELDPDKVRRAITPRTRLIILTSPHNPSGALASREALEEIGGMAEANDAHVLVDEVYLDASAASTRGRNEPQGTCVGLGSPFICTNSLTKSYGLSGLRCGWIVAPPDVARRIRRARDIVDGTGSIVSERLAALAFAHLDQLLKRATDILETNGAIICGFLRSRTEIDWIATGGTIVFPRLRGAADASAFAERLLFERDTAIVPGRFFQAPEHFRIGIGGPTDTLRAGLDAIAAALDARAWM